MSTDDAIAEVMARLGFVTRSEVDGLRERLDRAEAERVIERLTGQVSDLEKQAVDVITKAELQTKLDNREATR